MIRVPNLWLLYVEKPLESAVFYEKMFNQKPVTSFPTYVAFVFENGLTFGLWSIHADDFMSGGTGHRSEVAWMVENEKIVRELRDQWVLLGIPIEQDLHDAKFGCTFVALDPDGHRIRVCMPDK